MRRRVLLECFWTLLGLKSTKTLKKNSLRHSESGAQKHSRSTPWGTFRFSGPDTTPPLPHRDPGCSYTPGLECVAEVSRLHPPPPPKGPCRTPSPDPPVRCRDSRVVWTSRNPVTNHRESLVQCEAPERLQGCFMNVPHHGGI